MVHDIIVIKSNRIVDTDYATRRLRDLIKEAVRKLKEDQVDNDRIKIILEGENFD